MSISLQSKVLLEPHIKSKIINYIIGSWNVDSNDLVINEFTVGDSSRRVDLTLIKKNLTFAFEVKSDADTLSRLSGQVEKYLAYFDKVIVVTAPKHTKNVLEKTPQNVSVWEINEKGFFIKRKGRIKKINSKNSILEMMTLTELKKIARDEMVSIDHSSRKKIEANLTKLPVTRLRTYALRFITIRYYSRSADFFEGIQNRASCPEDLDFFKMYKREKIDARESSVDSFIHALENIKETYNRTEHLSE